MNLLALLFWLSTAWILYVWIGYPAILKGLSFVRRFRSVPA
jgi:hypothetical protein